MKDDSLDRLLRRTFHRDTTAEACPEPAILAALADGTLTAEERREVEVHASACSRCSAELALLARTGSLPATAVPEHRFRIPWRWAVPLATAVLVFAVWTELDRPRQESDFRKAGAPPTASSASIDEIDETAWRAAKEAAPPAEPGEPATSPLPRDKAAPAPPRDRQPAAPPPQTRAQEPLSTDEPEIVENRAAQRVEAPRQPSKPADGRALADLQSRAPESDADAGPESEGATPAPETTAEEATELLKVEAPPVKDRLAGASRADAFLVHGPGGVRIRAGQSGIERSADAGTTWRIERDAPSRFVRAGSCPTPEVCWLGGDEGRVLRRESSGRWVELRIPEPDTVTALDAPDATHATATTGGGRRFRTADGGRTWTALP